MLSAERTADAVRACGKRGVPFAIVGASGFAELGGKGAALQRDLKVAIEESDVRVLGPNCLGMIGVQDSAMPTFSSALDDAGRGRAAQGRAGGLPQPKWGLWRVRVQ
jgi:acyl-CoA synthetase (NDP forming)